MKLDPRTEDSVVAKLLVDTRAVSREDIGALQFIKDDDLLDILVKRQVIRTAEKKDAKVLLGRLTGGFNTKRHLKAKMDFVQIIARNVHRRLRQVSLKFRDQKLHVTGTWPLITDADLAKANGG